MMCPPESYFDRAPDTGDDLCTCLDLQEARRELMLRLLHTLE